MKFNLLLILTLILSVSSVFAADLIPQGNVQLKDRYGVNGSTWVNATRHCIGTSCMTDWTLAGNVTFNESYVLTLFATLGMLSGNMSIVYNNLSIVRSEVYANDSAVKIIIYNNDSTIRSEVYTNDTALQNGINLKANASEVYNNDSAIRVVIYNNDTSIRNEVYLNDSNLQVGINLKSNLTILAGNISAVLVEVYNNDTSIMNIIYTNNTNLQNGINLKSNSSTVYANITALDNATIVRQNGNANLSSLNSVLYVQQNNGSDIQAKINMCSANCTIIVPGTSLVIPSTLLIKDKVGINMQFLQGNVILPGVAYGVPFFNITNSSNVLIKGARFDYKGNNSPIYIQDSYSSNLTNIEFIDSEFINGVNGLIFRSIYNNTVIDGIKIIDSDFINMSSTPVVFNGVFYSPGELNGTLKNIDILNNYFTGVVKSPYAYVALTFGTRYSYSKQTDIRIKNNIFDNIKSNGILYGVNFRLSGNSSNIIVSQNKFTNLEANGTNAIIGINSATVTNAEYSNNYCANIWYNGTGDSESHCILDGNDGENLSINVVIKNNYAVNITSGAVGNNPNAKDGEAYYCKSDNCVITNNVAIDAGTGYAISMVGEENVSNCLVSNNYILYTTFTPLLAGIRSHCINSTIRDNTIKNIGNVPAIVLGGGGYTEFSGNTISNAGYIIGLVGGVTITDGTELMVRNNYYSNINTTISGYYVVTGWPSVKYFNNYLDDKSHDFNYRSLNNVKINTSSPVSNYNLYSYWSFDNGSTLDQVTYLNGTINGGAYITSGRIDEAYYFNSSQNINYPSYDFPLENVSEVTFSVWFNTNNLNTPQFIFSQSAARFNCDINVSSIARIQCNIRNSSDGQVAIYYFFNSSEQNRWVHLVAVFNPSYKAIYIDGVLKNNLTTLLMQPGAGYNLAAGLRIGSRSDGLAGSMFNGSIDELKIWNRSLTTDEVISEYMRTYPGKQAVFTRTSGVPYTSIINSPVACPANTFKTYDNYSNGTATCTSVTTVNNLTSTNATINVATIINATIQNLTVNNLIMNNTEIGIPLNNIVAMFHFEVNGSTAVDWSGLGYTATVYGNPTWVQNGGKFGSSYNLTPNNNDKRICLGTSSVFPYGNMTDRPFTWSAWAQRSDTTSNSESYIFSNNGYTTLCPNGYGTDCGGSYLHVAPNSVVFATVLSNNSYAGLPQVCSITFANLDIGTRWHHYAVTHNGTRGTYVKLYVDGVETANTSVSSGCSYFNSSEQWAMPGYAMNFCIGDSQYHSGKGFNGSIDEVIIFNTSLTSSQALALYSQTSELVTLDPFKGNIPINVSNLYFGNTYTTYNATWPNRPLVSNAATSKTVCASGCDYTTINSAMKDVPFILRHSYAINVGVGTFDEDVLVPPTISSFTGASEGGVGAFSIYGNSMNGTRVRSIQVLSSVGAWNPVISNMEIYGQEPRSDENASVSVYGAQSALLYRINFTARVTNAIMSYNGGVYVHSSIFNGSQNYALLQKAGGQSMFGDDYLNSSNNGSVITALTQITHLGMIQVNSRNNVTAPTLQICYPTLGGIVWYRNRAYCFNLASGNSTSEISKDRLMLSMSFDNTTSVYGNISLDSSGRNNDGVMYNTPTLNATNSFNNGTFITLNGSQYISIKANSSDYMKLSAGATFAFWYRTDNLSQAAGLVGDGASSKGLYVQQGGGTSRDNGVRMYLWNSSGGFKTSGSAIIPDTNWHHYAFVYDASNLLLTPYLDGVQSAASTSLTTYDIISSLDATTAIEIGRMNRFGYLYINGSLDNVFIYSRALTPTEIYTMFNNKINPDIPTTPKIGGTFYTLLGTGNQYVCVYSNGTLYRNTTCA